MGKGYVCIIGSKELKLFTIVCTTYHPEVRLYHLQKHCPAPLELIVFKQVDDHEAVKRSLQKKCTDFYSHDGWFRMGDFSLAPIKAWAGLSPLKCAT